MNNFSPNMLNTFEECQQKFFLKYVEKISLPQKVQFFEKGKKIHAIANYYLNGFDVLKMEKVLSDDEKKTWKLLKNSEYFSYKKIKTEFNLSCKIDKFWVGGRLDALVYQKNNYLILDYKTGQVPKNVQEDFQTIVYLLCVDKYLSKKSNYDALGFIYIGLKNQDEAKIELTTCLKKQYQEKIISVCGKIAEAIESNKFEKTLSKCKNCEYNKLCGVNL